jgi:LysM repeat protein
MGLRRLALFMAFLLAACSLATATPASSGVLPVSTATHAGELTPYRTRTPTATQTPGRLATSTSLPSPTATPRTHTIKRGETMLGIALLYRVSLEALLAANPKVNPNLMVVGTTLVIPESSGSQVTPDILPTPTPVPVTLEGVNCAVDAVGGAWCFVLARNQQKTPVENVSGLIRIADINGDKMQTQTAFPLLNLIPAGAALPLAAYFPAPVPFPLQASAELLTALPSKSNDQRYLPVKLEDFQEDIAGNGLSAIVKGKLVLDVDEGQASQVWVAVVAYDAAGRVVGQRRWESQAPLKKGDKMDFLQEVYSSSDPITRAEALVEAKAGK